MASITGSQYNDNGTYQISGDFPFFKRYDELKGTQRNDSIYGFRGDDILLGFGGNDYLNGGTGVDRMEGGPGADRYIVYDQEDAVIENSGEGRDLVWSAVEFTLPDHVEDLSLYNDLILSENGRNIRFYAPQDGTGNELSNRITGNKTDNWLRGLDGNDHVEGRHGDDRLYGGKGNDRLYGQQGNDRLYGDTGNDRLQGGSGMDVLFGDSGRDYLYGGTDWDVLVGGDGRDYLDGGAGADWMVGGRDNDVYSVDESGDLITERVGEGTDLVRASIDYTLGNQLENLVLQGTEDLSGTGNDLDNILRGNRGSNVLSGQAGSDTLIGYGGIRQEYDRLTGGSGSDTFVLGDFQGSFYEDLGYGTITDFDVKASVLDLEFDQIQLTGELSDYRLGSHDWSGSSAADTIIYKGDDVIGVVQDVTGLSLTSDSFTTVAYNPLT